ncbi:MAG TPA: hypothetical protein PK985_03705 [Bacillota bacterium]|nr:hypothetical protein [Bacillota bacterium]
MRAVKALLVAFFIITLVTGYIIYNSGMSISISFKNPSWNKTGDQDIETGTAGAAVPDDETGAAGSANTPGDAGTADPADTDDAKTPDGAAASALPVVRRVHELFQSRREDDEKSFREIIDLLPGIDWSLYAKEYDAAGAKEVLEWISQSPYTAEGENVLNIFKATKGLDGVLSDQYGVIVGEFFRNDTDKYVKLLARLDRQSIDRVCRFTANNNYYHVEPEEAVESITARFEGRDLTDSERYVVDSMLKAIKAYITEKST